MTQIVPIQRKYIKGFRDALDYVAREEKYLFILKAPSFKKVKRFVLSNIKNKVTQFVVLDGDQVVGWCDIRPQNHPTTKHIGVLAMGLLPHYRRKGIGSKLMRECLRHAKKRGIELVRLDVYVSNKGAIRLYEKYGFSIEGIQKKARKLKGKYYNLILMVKELK